MMNRMRLWLIQANPVVFVLFAGLAGFCAYFSMYAFPQALHGGDLRCGPGLAFGARLQDRPGHRPGRRLRPVQADRREGDRGDAAPASRGGDPEPHRRVLDRPGPVRPDGRRPWNVAALFLNGLPLGLIWGLVFGFMEGRRTSEVLGAILCASLHPVVRRGEIGGQGADADLARQRVLDAGGRRPRLHARPGPVRPGPGRPAPRPAPPTRPNGWRAGR